VSILVKVNSRKPPYTSFRTPSELIDFMVADPILINRPIVETPLGVHLCRPSERVLEILPNTYIGPFVKEDGAVVIDEVGSRVA